MHFTVVEILLSISKSRIKAKNIKYNMLYRITCLIIGSNSLTLGKTFPTIIIEIMLKIKKTTIVTTYKKGVT